MKRIIPLVLVLAALVVGIYYVRTADQNEQYQISSLYTEVEPLQKERTNLIEERNELVEQYRVSLRDASTVQILIREMREEIFTDIYPLMRERNVTGVLGMSMKEYPGRSGHQLTVEQYSRLLMDGWGSCLVFDSDYENKIESWIDYMRRHLEREGVELPKAVYFPEGNYDPDTMDEALLAGGINTVIVNAEDGHSNTASKVGAIWVTGAMPWNYTGVNTDIELLKITDGANLCFTVSIENLWDAYEKDGFVAMLDSWQDFLVFETVVEPSPTPTPVVSTAVTEDPPVEPLIWVTTFEKARAAHLEAEVGLNTLVSEHEQALADLDSRIAQLDTQIKAIYDKWNGK